MEIGGWNFEYTTLPHWSDREEYPCTDCMLESPNGEVGCLIYSIPEVENALGYCAILSNKAQPALLLSILEIVFDKAVTFSRDQRFLILRARYRRDKWFLLILDLAEQKYSVEHTVPIARQYSIEERADGEFEILVEGRSPMALSGVSVENAWLQGTMRRLFSVHGKRRWRSWRDLAEGADLNLQERSFFSIFRSREHIWRESLELVAFGMITAQEFVDRNQSKRLWFPSPFRVGPSGRVQAISMQNVEFDGRFLPAFTTEEACLAHCRAQNWDSSVMLCRASLKRLMQTMDSHYLTRTWGIIIDPDGKRSLMIPPGVRVTPKSLRY